MFKSAPLWVIRLILLVLASYGLLYFSYKFHIPWSGANDFAHYYAMYLQPLDLSAASGPFVFRQLSALLTHAVYVSGIYYPNDIWFSDPKYDQRVFFAAIFSNYLCLIAAAWLAGVAVEIKTGTSSLVYPLIAGLLCFLSFHSQSLVLTGLTEGLNWLMTTAGFIAYLQRRLILLGAILILAVFQRETIIIAFSVIAACGLVLDGVAAGGRQFNAKVLGWTLVCFILYVIMRKVSGVEGYNEQVNSSALFAGLQQFHPTRQLVFQGLISQNVLLIYGLLCLIAVRKMPEQRFWIPALSATFIVLLLVGLAAGIGNNVGRICGILTPIFAIFSSTALQHIESARAPQNHGDAQPGAPADASASRPRS